MAVSEGVQRSLIKLANDADQIAELVLRSIDGDLPNRVMAAGELKGLQRAEDGEIHPRST